MHTKSILLSTFVLSWIYFAEGASPAIGSWTVLSKDSDLSKMQLMTPEQISQVEITTSFQTLAVQSSQDILVKERKKKNNLYIRISDLIGVASIQPTTDKLNHDIEILQQQIDETQKQKQLMEKQRRETESNQKRNQDILKILDVSENEKHEEEIQLTKDIDELTNKLEELDKEIDETRKKAEENRKNIQQRSDKLRKASAEGSVLAIHKALKSITIDDNKKKYILRQIEQDPILYFRDFLSSVGVFGLYPSIIGLVRPMVNYSEDLPGGLKPVFFQQVINTKQIGSKRLTSIDPLAAYFLT